MVNRCGFRGQQVRHWLDTASVSKCYQLLPDLPDLPDLPERGEGRAGRRASAGATRFPAVPMHRRRRCEVNRTGEAGRPRLSGSRGGATPRPRLRQHLPLAGTITPLRPARQRSASAGQHARFLPTAQRPVNRGVADADRPRDGADRLASRSTPPDLGVPFRRCSAERWRVFRGTFHGCSAWNW